MSLKDKIAEARQMVTDLAGEADAFESKRLRKILLSAAERLGDAERHPLVSPQEWGLQTGEPNPMTDGIKANADGGGDPGSQGVNMFPGAQTGEPNPTLG